MEELNILIQVNHSKHSNNETQVMEQLIFSFGIKEQLTVMLQNVNDINKRAHPLEAASSVCVTRPNLFHQKSIREEGTSANEFKNPLSKSKAKVQD